MEAILVTVFLLFSVCLVVLGSVNRMAFYRKKRATDDETDLI